MFALLLFPHTWVRRLQESLFAVTQSSAQTMTAVEGSPLTHAAMRYIADKLCTMLKSPNVEAPTDITDRQESILHRQMVRRSHPQESRITQGSDCEVVSKGNDVTESEVWDGRGSDQLLWLFSKLSFQVRSAHIARRNTTTAEVGTVYLL